MPSADRLDRSFYARDALVLARALIGTRIVVTAPVSRDGAGGAAPTGSDREPRVARIVETEAYRGPLDLACHARVGVTKRTKTMYGPPGHGYVFLIYGMYDCFNVVCFGEGKGHAVLVRAVEPLAGIATSLKTDGPGKLTRALGITRAHDATDLVDGAAIQLLPRQGRPKIGVTARVGVAYAGAWADEPWRFFEEGNRFVSRPPARAIGRGVAR